MFQKEPKRRRIALVIGNSAYRYVGPLSNPVIDAARMTEVLDDLGFEVALELDLTRDATLAAIDRFLARIAASDQADDGPVELSCLYYAGHGVELQGKNYIVPCDYTSPDDPVGAPVPVHEILEPMSGFSLRSLLFLDACRNAAGIDPGEFNDETLHLTTSGLAKMTLPVERGTLISFAADPGDVAGDGEPGAGSPFTNALARHLPRQNLDVHHALQGVADEVRRATNGDQRPWSYSNLAEPLPLREGSWAPVKWSACGGRPCRRTLSFRPRYRVPGELRARESHFGFDRDSAVLGRFGCSGFRIRESACEASRDSLPDKLFCYRCGLVPTGHALRGGWTAGPAQSSPEQPRQSAALRSSGYAGPRLRNDRAHQRAERPAP